MKLKIISEKPIPFAEVKQLLQDIKEEGKQDLSFVAQKTYDYLEQCSSLDTKKAEALFKKLTALEIPRLKDIHIWKLIDLMPKDPKDVRTILQGYGITLTSDQLKKIVDVLTE